MKEEIVEAVKYQIAQFEQNTDFRVAPETTLLITILLNDIVESPHPSWSTRSAKLRGKTIYLNSESGLLELARVYIATIPGALQQIVNREGVKDTVGPFDFLHWFADVFHPGSNIGNCLIEK